MALSAMGLGLFGFIGTELVPSEFLGSGLRTETVPLTVGGPNLKEMC